MSRENVEIVRRGFEAFLRGDLDSALADVHEDFVATRIAPMPDITPYHGPGGLLQILADWTEGFDDFEMTPEEFAVSLEEVRDLGNGVTFAVILQQGRLVRSSGQVQLRNAMVDVWVDGLIARTVTGPDIEEARAAAERLAEERA
jgi:ketosteroid isomerase-like protein